MRNEIVLVAVLVVSMGAAAQQDILHYKFESGAGSAEVNYGDPTPGIPGVGQVVLAQGVQPAQAWGPGKFGGGLAAGPAGPFAGSEIDTGWDVAVGTGVDVTLAFFFKAVWGLPNNTGGLFCGQSGNGPGIKASISGIPSSYGNVALSWQASTGNQSSMLLQDLLTPAFANWVHLAFVIDRDPGCQNAIVQWFVNGVPQPPQNTGSCFNNLAGTSIESFRIGQKGSAYFRFDDWRVSLRAVPAAEILQWATMDRADDAPFGDACHPFGLPVLLWGSGGLPTVGNAAYKLTTYGLPGSMVFLGIGLSDTSFAGMPLPLDLGTLVPTLAGCQLRASADLTAMLNIGPTGSVDFATAIPAAPMLVGVDAYAQAVLYSPILGQWSSTNAWAIHIGN